MARAQSVVLSKTEKKAVVVELKAKLKAAKDAAAVEAGNQKAADKALAAATKAHAASVKAISKAQASAAKTVLGLAAQLASLTAPATTAA